MEGIGVFALCWIGGMSCYNVKDPVGIALAHMLALGILIYVGAATSGANFNPAVSIALAATGQMTWMRCV